MGHPGKQPSLAAGYTQRTTSQNPCSQCIRLVIPECSLRDLLQVGRILGLLVNEFINSSLRHSLIAQINSQDSEVAVPFLNILD